MHYLIRLTASTEDGHCLPLAAVIGQAPDLEAATDLGLDLDCVLGAVVVIVEGGADGPAPVVAVIDQ